MEEEEEGGKKGDDDKEEEVVEEGNDDNEKEDVVKEGEEDKEKEEEEERVWAERFEKKRKREAEHSQGIAENLFLARFGKFLRYSARSSKPASIAQMQLEGSEGCRRYAAMLRAWAAALARQETLPLELGWWDCQFCR